MAGFGALPLWRDAPALTACLIAAWLATATAVTTPTDATAAVRITDDRGGNIGEYWARFTALRNAREQVIIDGACFSACTLVLGIVRPEQICVTRNAQFGFHAAWRPGFLGFRVINEPATRTLMNFYPDPIRQWIARNGGLGTDMMYLSGRELIGMYRECQ